MFLESPGGDKDDAVWLNVETNEWKSNPEHYTLPRSVAEAEGLHEHLELLDAEDGRVDGVWMDNDILNLPDRWEETPAFIEYHRDALVEMVRREGYGVDRVTDLLYTNFKQIDRLGHYFNMDSEEVNAALLKSDEVLGDLLTFLDRDVGRGNYVVILTADHGQQPDADAVGGYGIDPNELRDDINREFGEIARAVWPTEVFLYGDRLEGSGVSVEDVARFIGDYRLEDNVPGDEVFTGTFEAGDRLFDLAIPAVMLETVVCPT